MGDWEWHACACACVFVVPRESCYEVKSGSLYYAWLCPLYSKCSVILRPCWCNFKKIPSMQPKVCEHHEILIDVSSNRQFLVAALILFQIIISFISQYECRYYKMLNVFYFKTWRKNCPDNNLLRHAIMWHARRLALGMIMSLIQSTSYQRYQEHLGRWVS